MVDHRGRIPDTPAGLALAARVVRVAGWLVPTALRGDWEREWHAELWHLHRSLAARGAPSARERAALALRSAGSLFDALQLRLGDPQSWRESLSAVVTRWGEHTRSVAAALLFLSVGIAADALLIAFGYLMVWDSRSVWSSLTSDARWQVLGVATACGVSMIVASAVAAARLLGPYRPPSPHDDRGVRVVEMALVAGLTGWLGRWFAAFGVRTAVAPHSGEWLATVDVGAAVTAAWVVSWLSGLTVLTMLRRHRRARPAVPPGWS